MKSIVSQNPSADMDSAIVKALAKGRGGPTGLTDRAWASGVPCQTHKKTPALSFRLFWIQGVANTHTHIHSHTSQTVTTPRV